MAQIAHELSMHTTDMVTLAVPINNPRDAANSNIVKVVLDTEGDTFVLFAGCGSMAKCHW
jgi:CMP-2-keto-3-deoxyoctulosonic acid synthetase